MAAKKNILIVEDDEDIQQLVSYNLLKAGFLVECMGSGEQALERLQGQQLPDLILLDIMLPGVAGTELCRRLKGDEHFNAIPIVMLTAKGEEEDVVAGLDLGADDYITKPFSPKILVSRIKAVLRRQAKEASPLPERSEILQLGDLVIDPSRHEVRVGDSAINLTPTEFGILHFLAGKSGWVFSRQQIIDAIRGFDYLITPRSVDVQVFSLRKKLGSAGHRIETVRGIGYRFKDKAM